MFGTIALLGGLGVFLFLLYSSMVYALPITIGLWAGFWAMHAGAGVGSVLIGLAAGAAGFALGQFVIATSRSPLIRRIVLLSFTVPAVIAGYSMILQLAQLGVASLVWRYIFAVVGAAAIACMVISRLVPQPLSTPRP
jgi:hypothetical protein